MTPESVLAFWFVESTPAQWFRKDNAYDATIRTRFWETYQKAIKGELEEWRKTPQGRLAEVIVLDQFSRNLFRNSGEAFAHDQKALALAREAVAVGDDRRLPRAQRRFLYMPFMHAESREAHRTAIWLFVSLLNPGVVYFEWKHKHIIDRFGRYPHRNALLGRESTPEEIEFLKTHKGF